MANRNSIQARHSTPLRGPASRTPILKPIPMLFAALLVGCASNAHHTTGALTQKPEAAATGYQPPPYQDPARSTTAAAEETPPTPPVFKDEGASEPAESAARPERFEDDAVAQNDEGSPNADRFTDEAGTTPEENFAQHPFVADEVAPVEEGALAQNQFTDDASPAKDEAVVAPERFSDDAPAAADDSAAGHQQFTDDAAPPKDDDVVAQQFTDDTPAAKDEAVATEEYTDEGTTAAPENFVRTPESLSERKVAQAEEPKQRPVTMLPMTITVEADPLFGFDQDSISAEARKKLDELIRQLKGIPYGEVITLGYTDPIGTEAYNQKLSERRAASVTQYLVRNGIPKAKIRVEARGETEEFASYKACKAQGKQKLIDCLQPDRRVEVTVTTGKEQTTAKEQ